MKPVNFDYLAPTDVVEALALLEQYGDEAKILAGGQSLMPLMNLRLARPRVIIDINRLSDLAYISPDPNGGMAIGALTRQRAMERSSLVHERNPLLAAAMPLIGHFQIRNRGTIGGSLVHADPAAELPALSIALEAEFVLRCAHRQRVMPAEGFFLSYLTTAIEPAELLTEIRIPAWKPGAGWAIEEVCRREGDFALVGATILLHLDAHEACQDVCVVLFGVGGTPVRIRKAEGMLRGRALDARALTEVARVVSEDLEPDSDLHASAEYRKEVGGVLTRRALEAALTRGKGGIHA
ncbi:MAG: xanthine dehydrogenase family protein subunit M [Nitrospinae bacterium]|nr:xanthine dehydrogenase family protein subunit M [Nitrospinota bacterium]